jgi:hypothetical protein
MWFPVVRGRMSDDTVSAVRLETLKHAMPYGVPDPIHRKLIRASKPQIDESVCRRQLPSRCTQDEILRLGSALINCGAQFGPHKAHSLSFVIRGHHWTSHLHMQRTLFFLNRRMESSVWLLSKIGQEYDSIS